MFGSEDVGSPSIQGTDTDPPSQTCRLSFAYPPQTFHPTSVTRLRSTDYMNWKNRNRGNWTHNINKKDNIQQKCYPI